MGEPRPFGPQLRAWRRAAGLKQAALAASLGLHSRSTVSQWERGETRPEVDLLPRLATALNVGLSELLAAYLGVPVRLAAETSGAHLAGAAGQLDHADRTRLRLLLDVWRRPRDAVEDLLAEQLRGLLDRVSQHRCVGPPPPTS
jgi:transcriptional regulator with XRE-family HTH domain